MIQSSTNNSSANNFYNNHNSICNLYEDDIPYIWRRNCPYLYDMMLSYTLEWPTLTIDWLPNSYKSADGNYSVHKIIYGTHTSGQELNYLIIAEVHLSDMESNNDLMNNESFAEYNYNADNTNINSVQFEVKAKLNHPNEVNSAMHMPEHPFIIATRTVNGDILIFDYSKHESFPTDELIHPQLLLKGHTMEGYSMDWNNNSPNNSSLISGGSDKNIYLWDFNGNTNTILSSSTRNQSIYYPENHQVDTIDQSLPVMTPTNNYLWHQGDVNDLKWHPCSDSIFASVSDDDAFAFWDIRSSSRNIPVLYKYKGNGINAISFNQFIPTMFSTGDVDGVIEIWDIRNTKEALFNLNYHSNKSIVKIEWSNWSPNILCSGGVDGKVVVWDLYNNKNDRTKIHPVISENIAEPKKEKSLGIPSEVIFVHHGHSAAITGISWNPNEHADPLLIASASEDNTIQFWQFSDIYLKSMQ